MTEPATISVLRSPCGTAFPPTQRSAELIRQSQMNSTLQMTAVQPGRTPDSTNRRLTFTASPNAQQTHGNHGTQHGSNGSQQPKNIGHQIGNNGTGNGMDSGQHGTDSRNKQDGTPQKNLQPKAFERPAFLHTAGPAQAINMDDIIGKTINYSTAINPIACRCFNPLRHVVQP